MNTSFSVASVTVAYNGCHLLTKHLTALHRQNRKVNEIIVVDNGSIDGTQALLRREYPQVTLLPLSQNQGIGGGTSVGLAYAATTKRHDWIWLLDQDSVPNDDALARLLEGLQLLKDHASDAAILAPHCIDPLTKRSCLPMLWENGRWQVPPETSKSPTSFVDATIASGSLIRREAVEKAGLPRADFFMDFVDLEYCLRLRRNGYKIVVVRDSIMRHPVGAARKIKFLGHTAIWSDHFPWRHYYMARNEVFTIWNYYPSWKAKCCVARRLSERALRLLLYGRRKRDCLKMMLLGVIDGRKGRLGIRFLPEAM